ncbi:MULTISPECIES: leucyl aminopeptidase [unclassified Corynebacterium]|uniref:leucyl aminopeptidase n=1 Tax=unclassified Corynebacterium TaxID=2624378 RepID=UPI0029CA7173|nr:MULTISPECIES: leucyl aminopeptidase [unclassified Corynebacterium]WPF65478.1 leucyl aminopeptidase [Corynebacterium sp. 22KM0430]WPF67974.1 leucyl aminopeptidase [Corynebacterium sp. 21KM1197]
MLSGLPVRGTLASATLAKTAPDHAPVILIPAFSGEDGPEFPLTDLLTAKAARGVVASAEAVGFSGTTGEVAVLPAPAKISAQAVALLGLGEASEFDNEVLRRAMGTAARRLRAHGDVITALGNLGDGALGAAAEGYLLGSYLYPGQRSPERSTDKTGKTDKPAKGTAAHGTAPGTITFIGGGKRDKEALRHATITAEAVALARDLTNTSARDLYPASYADTLADLAAEYGVEAEIYDAYRLSAEGFGGILAVGAGSQRAPRLVRLHWKPSEEAAATSTAAPAHVALVGKGITFDTGGISLKPPANMEIMISDMGGSAAMAASIFAAARLGLPVEITAWLPLAENMPSGSATRPGDVITHYGGLTSEVINTDAEGRLVLADALARASEDRPDVILEAATLTGGQLVALGTRTAGVMGSEDLRDLVAQAGQEVGESAWSMPLLEEHSEALSSPVADVRNTHNSRNGQMLFAGAYLSRFIAEGIEWAHLDVAGPAWNEGAAYGYTPQRATGAPVRTVVRMLEHLANQED